jgi:beta-ketoacyl synthase-like protein
VLKIAVERWSAWEPREGLPAVFSSFSHGKMSSSDIEKPDLAGVPAMQRRRLGRLARVVFHVLDRCADTSEQEPVVFSSLMGEIQRTQEILQSIAADEPVSPMSFSLSVHNAVGGQWSVIHGIKAPMLALSPPANSPIPALLEAAGLLQEGVYSAVNVVYYEENYPVFYSPFLDGPSAPTALAMRLIPADRSLETLALQLDLRRLPGKSGVPPWDNYSVLLDILRGDRSDAMVREPCCRWQLGMFK